MMARDLMSMSLKGFIDIEGGNTVVTSEELEETLSHVNTTPAVFEDNA